MIRWGQEILYTEDKGKEEIELRLPETQKWKEESRDAILITLLSLGDCDYFVERSRESSPTP